MYLCECVHPCTRLGAQGKSRYYGLGERQTFAECPAHFKVIEDLGGAEPEKAVEAEEILEDGLPDFKTKKEMEDYARTLDPPLELDRRKNMDELRAEILEHITKPAE